MGRWELTKLKNLLAGLVIMTGSVWWTNYQNPVEQQTPGGATQPDHSLWVINPTIGTSNVCVWDADDQINLNFGGVIESGQTITYTTCLFGDWADHVIGMSRGSNARNTGVKIEASLSVDGITTINVQDKACIIGPDYDRDYPSFETIAGSNGGRAVRHTVTWTVHNPTVKRLRNDWAAGAIRLWTDSSQSTWCPPTLTRHGTYPGPTWYQ